MEELLDKFDELSKIDQKDFIDQLIKKSGVTLIAKRLIYLFGVEQVSEEIFNDPTKFDISDILVNLNEEKLIIYVAGLDGAIESCYDELSFSEQRDFIRSKIVEML